MVETWQPSLFGIVWSCYTTYSVHIATIVAQLTQNSVRTVNSVREKEAEHSRSTDPRRRQHTQLHTDTHIHTDREMDGV